MRTYHYPKECFGINETLTKRNMEQYEQKVDKWYEVAERMFPNYFKMNLRERLKVKDLINNTVGYSI